MSLVASIVPSVVSIITICVQYYISKNNNERLLKSDKLNNENQLNLKRLDYYYSEKVLAINTYIDCLFKYLNDKSKENLFYYQIAKAKACMYLSSSACDQAEIINFKISKNQINDFYDTDLEFLIDELRKDSQQNK